MSCPTDPAQPRAEHARGERRAARPRVSVVIPTYNRAAILRRLLARLAECGVPEGGMEVIVVDDGSTDETGSVTASPHIRILTQPHAGGAAAREHGRCVAGGDRLIFFDDDVVPERDAIVELAAALDRYDGVGARMLPLSTRGTIESFAEADGLVDHRIQDGRVRWLVDAAVAYRRSALDAVGGYDTRFLAAGEDVDLSMRMLEHGFTLGVAPRAVVVHGHRSRLLPLLQSYYQRGQAHEALLQKHPQLRAAAISSTVDALNPLVWAGHYRRYRSVASPARACAFIGLRAAGLVAYGAGAARARAARGR